jgi:hypothetical protein
VVAELLLVSYVAEDHSLKLGGGVNVLIKQLLLLVSKVFKFVRVSVLRVVL